MPDHFDRLVGRAAPEPAPGAGAEDGGVVRVRPRLPGPFERMDAFGAGEIAWDVQERAAEEPARRAEEPVRSAPVSSQARTAEMTERQTAEPRLPLVLREQPAPERGILTPAVVPPPPVPDPTARSGERTGAEEAQPQRPAVVGRHTTELTVRHESSEARPESSARTVSAVPAQTARPAARPAAPAAGRQSARDNARQRQPERTVHISIGRLEVRAAGRRSDGAARAAEQRGGQRSGRPSPVLSLEKYLSREEGQR